MWSGNTGSELALDEHYDPVINLEDTVEVAQFLKTVRCRNIFGIYGTYKSTDV
jgi:hypothetical protein